MHLKAKRTSGWLIYLGLLPFVAFAIGQVLDVQTLPPFGSLDQAFALYCFGISSFMAGIHWGLTLSCNREQIDQSMMLLSAVLLVVLPLVCLVVFGARWIFYAVEIVVFLKLFAIDRSLYHESILDQAYYHQRKLATTVVVTSLFLIMLQGLL